MCQRSTPDDGRRTRMRVASRTAAVREEITTNVADLRRFAASPARSGGGFRRGRNLAQGDRGAEPRLCRGNARHCRRLQADASRPWPSSMRATSWRSPCWAGGDAQKAGAGELLEIGPDGCTTFGVTPEAADDRHTWLGQELGLALKACMGARSSSLRARRNGQAELRSASPRPASPAGRWASTHAASGWSRRGLKPRWPRSVLQAVPRAVPRSARRRNIRTCAAAGDRYAPHLFGQLCHRGGRRQSSIWRRVRTT